MDSKILHRGKVVRDKHRDRSAREWIQYHVWLYLRLKVHENVSNSERMGTEKDTDNGRKGTLGIS